MSVIQEPGRSQSGFFAPFRLAFDPEVVYNCLVELIYVQHERILVPGKAKITNRFGYALSVEKKKSKRILVGKLQRKGKQPNITHEEIALAIRHFKDQGGLIKELPPQRGSYRPTVGGHLGSAYEAVIEN